MTVSLSESDISSVKRGQIATVSLSALSGVELGGKVTSISPLGSSSDGVVSYDVTLTIYQYNSKVLPGMSATATIVTDQQQGVTLPTDAVTGSGSNATVELDQNGKTTSKTVQVGLSGTSREVILSGLKSGQEVKVTITLPALGVSTTSTTSTTGTSGFPGGRRYRRLRRPRCRPAVVLRWQWRGLSHGKRLKARNRAPGRAEDVRAGRPRSARTARYQSHVAAR